MPATQATARDAKFKYSQISLYGHLIITDSLLCPLGKKAPTSVFSKFNPLNTDTPFTDTFEFHGSLSACVLTGFDCRKLVKIFHFES